MRKIKFIMSFVFILFVGLVANHVKASSFSEFTKNDLMYIEVNGTGRIITKTTTVDEIASWYGGKIRLETDSLFGGKAYSFYTGNKFDDYLYIETIADGQIFSYGSVDPSYKTNTYNFGDNYPYNERNTLYGCLLSDSGKIVGGVYYNKNIYQGGNFKKILESYTQRFDEEYCKVNYLSDKSQIGSANDMGVQSRVMLDMSEHAVLMYNALIHYYNKDDSFLETDKDENGNDTFKTLENYFYINNQFLEFKSNILAYTLGMGYGTSFYTAIGTSTGVGLSYSSYYIFNPLLLAGMAKSQKSKDLSQRNVPVWTYNYANKILIGTAYSPKIFDRNEPVELTQEESKKLTSGRAYYNEAINKLNKSSQLYKTEPIYDTTSGMRAGELTEDKKEGITAYFNAIRAASGLGLVKASSEGFNIIQHLTTLLEYQWLYLGKGIEHLPDQPPGLPDNYYTTARGDEKSWGSNLSFAMKTPNVDSMLYHIKNLLMDEPSKSTDYTLGHRRSLLKPSFSLFGYGITGFIGAVNLSGYQDWDYDCNGLPAVNGVTFLETLTNRRFTWTASFNESKYLVNNNTKTTVKCINTGKVWTYTSEVNQDGRIYQNVCLNESTIDSASNKILLYEHEIEPMTGYVYEVTVSNLTDVKTNRNDATYKYRTVFEYADSLMNPSTSNSMKIDTTNLYKMEDYQNVYQAPIGRALKLRVKLSNTDVADLKLTWSSSNPDVISVTQDGTIYASKPSEEQVVISVKMDGSDVTDQIILMPYISLKDVTMTPSNVEMDASEKTSQVFKIVTVPDDVTEILDIQWVLSDGNNEYYLTKTPDNSKYKGAYIFQLDNQIDKNLNEYFQVEAINVGLDSSEKLLRNIQIKVVAPNKNVSQYSLKTYVKAMSDMYHDDRNYGGVSNISVSSKISSVESIVTVNGKNIVLDDCGKKITTTQTITITGNEPYEYNLSAKTYPEDALETNPNLAWSVVSGNNIASIKNGNKLVVNGIGKIKIKRSGVKERTFEVNIVAPAQKIELSSTLTNTKDGRYVKAYSSEDKFCTLELTTKIVPSISKDTIKYSIKKGEGDTIATVNQNGVVSFTGVGNVTVIASAPNTSVTAEYKIAVVQGIEGFTFGNDNTGKAITCFNLDISNKEFDANGEMHIQGPKATYKGYDKAKVAKAQLITYSIDGDPGTINGKPAVEVDDDGVLCIRGAVDSSNNVKVKANVTGPDGRNSYREYSLIINNESKKDGIRISSGNMTPVYEGDYPTFYVNTGNTYNFIISNDTRANDEIEVEKVISSTVNTISTGGNVATVIVDEAGEHLISCSLINKKKQLVDDEDGDGISYSQGLKVVEGTLSDQFGEYKGVKNSFMFKIIASDYQKGDVNKDGIVNSTDSAIVLDLFKNGNAKEEDYRLGDMDNNGVLNSTDSAMILDIYKSN